MATTLINKGVSSNNTTFTRNTGTSVSSTNSGLVPAGDGTTITPNGDSTSTTTTVSSQYKKFEKNSWFSKYCKDAYHPHYKKFHWKKLYNKWKAGKLSNDEWNAILNFISTDNIVVTRQTNETNTNPWYTLAEPIPWTTNTINLRLKYTEDNVEKQIDMENVSLSGFNRDITQAEVGFYDITVPDEDGNQHMLEYMLKFEKYPTNIVYKWGDIDNPINIYPLNTTYINFVERSVINENKTTIQYFNGEDCLVTYNNTTYGNTYIAYYSERNYMSTTSKQGTSAYFDNMKMYVDLADSYTSYTNNTYVNTLALKEATNKLDDELLAGLIIMPTGDSSTKDTSYGLYMPIIIHSMMYQDNAYTTNIQKMVNEIPAYIDLVNVDNLPDSWRHSISTYNIIYSYGLDGKFDRIPAMYDEYVYKDEYTYKNASMPKFIAHKTGYTDEEHTHINNLSTIPFDWAEYNEDTETYTASITTYLVNPNTFVQLDDANTYVFNYSCELGCYPKFTYVNQSDEDYFYADSYTYESDNITYIEYGTRHNYVINQIISGNFGNTLSSINDLDGNTDIELSLTGLACEWRDADDNVLNRFTYETVVTDTSGLYKIDTYENSYYLNLVGFIYENTTYSIKLCENLYLSSNFLSRENDFEFVRDKSTEKYWSKQYLAYTSSQDEYTITPKFSKKYKNEMVPLQ